MRLVAITAAVFLGALAQVIYSPSSAHAAPSSTAKSKTVVTVKAGDSLSAIAQEHNTTYLRMFYANTSIEDPDVIHPGDKVRVPAKNEKLKERALPESAPVAATPASATTRTSAPAQPRSAYRPAHTSSSVSGGVWDRLAACESGGNWSINTGNGFYGGLQFTLSSWQAVGGSGYPHHASKSEQIARGQALQAQQGWGAWPACAAKLGLR